MDLQTSNLMFGNPKYDKVTERLTPAKIEKPTLLDWSLIFGTKFGSIGVKFHFCNIDEVGWWLNRSSIRMK